jgi:hypothetical protein
MVQTEPSALAVFENAAGKGAWPVVPSAAPGRPSPASPKHLSSLSNRGGVASSREAGERDGILDRVL